MTRRCLRAAPPRLKPPLPPFAKNSTHCIPILFLSMDHPHPMEWNGTTTGGRDGGRSRKTDRRSRGASSTNHQYPCSLIVPWPARREERRSRAEIWSDRSPPSLPSLPHPDRIYRRLDPPSTACSFIRYHDCNAHYCPT